MQPPSASASLSPPRVQVAGDAEHWAELIQTVSRPVLIHLNADTTWLLQLPYPPNANLPPGRTRFNILIDPWLQGPQSDLHSLFNTQWHVVAPSVATIHELNKVLRDIEQRPACAAANGHNGSPNSKSDSSPPRQQPTQPQGSAPDSASMIDAVVISHEFTDHCHQKTLLELPPSTPVYAADVAADLIRSWSYFDQVITTPALGAGVQWSRLTVGPLPDWLAIGRVITPGNALYFHAASLIAFDLGRGNGGEAIIYSPHGIESKDLAGIESSGLRTLALLHGLDDVRIWMTKQLNLGALNGIKAAKTCKAKFWIATHDEVKKGRGLIAALLQRTRYSAQEAVAHEKLMEHSAGEDAPSYHLIELGSGDGVVLVS